MIEHLETTRPRRAVVVGGGYIGIETAETFVRRGLSTTLVTMREVTDMGQVMTRLRDAVELVEQSRSTLALPTGREQPVDEVLAHSPGLAAVRETARQYAAVDATVLVLCVKPSGLLYCTSCP